MLIFESKNISRVAAPLTFLPRKNLSFCESARANIEKGKSKARIARIARMVERQLECEEEMNMKGVKVGDTVGCEAYHVDGIAVGVVKSATPARCIALTFIVGEQGLTFSMGGEMALGLIKGVVEGLAVLVAKGLLRGE